jgi:DNA-binding transcriptional ArsR family regulator
MPICTYMNDNKLTLSQEINQLHANICSAISEPNRILLIYAIHENPRNVNNLAEYVGISQSAASRHLKLLKDRDLITAQRHGNQVIYSLADDRIIKALNMLRELMLDNLNQRANLLKANQSMETGEL